MGHINNLIKVIKNSKKASCLLKDAEEKNRQLVSLSERIRTEKLDNMLKQSNCYIPKSSESYKIGTALILANCYSLKFGIGTCFGDCRVLLEKCDWLYPLDKTIPTTNYGTWTSRNPNEVSEIYAYGRTVLEAILKCLINARIAKVI